ncbi:hypothetical protein NKJ88_05755 [Mesorhizobium sp. M0016]|uniref:hypothetical protein n=1 Tax=Mesorhizobium sp. M0016 TaxID=2956843 RepID=UPI003338B815
MKRQEIERQVAKRAIKELLEAGYLLGVNDGEETVIERSTDADAIFKEMFATDEDYLLVYRPGETVHFAYVWFIYGNSGWDVISDYTTNLETVLKPVSDFAQTFED